MPTTPEFLVDFVIGGTQKGGTSALAHFLSAHPELCLPQQKEVHLFDAPDFCDQNQGEEIKQLYRAAFPQDLTGRIVGEATPIYMYLPWIAPRIKTYNPAMKWILLLRDPVERAISHYSMERGRGAERLPLAMALRVEWLRRWRERDRTAWRSSWRTHSYLDRGYYSRQLENLWQWFPREQVLVLTSEQLQHQHHETLQLVYAFLEVNDRTFVPPAATIFATAEKRPVARAERGWIRRHFTADRRRLEQMLGRSFASW